MRAAAPSELADAARRAAAAGEPAFVVRFVAGALRALVYDALGSDPGLAAFARLQALKHALGGRSATPAPTVREAG